MPKRRWSCQDGAGPLHSLFGVLHLLAHLQSKSMNAFCYFAHMDSLATSTATGFDEVD